MHPDHIFKALAKHLQRANGRPSGHAHGVADGLEIRCAGLMGPNPRYAEDFAAGFNPEKEILIQHVIGTFRLTEEAKKLGVERFSVGNKEHDGEFVLDDAQKNLDPSKPVCQICGQEPIL